jgi:bacterial/archaeal transporter family-2 protein
VVAFGAGLVVAVQSRINGELGHLTGSGVLAAAVNFAVGLVLLVLVVAGRSATRSALRTLPGRVRRLELPWWTLAGGLGGAVYVSGQSASVAALGVALFTVATVAGSTGLGLAVDRWGFGPSGPVPLTVARVLAAVLATVAVWVGSGGRAETGSAPLGFLLLALAAGGAGSVQVALNGRVSAATGQPTVAALVNFTVGLSVLLTILLVQQTVSPEAVGSLAPLRDEPWLLVGGAMGVWFVVSSAWAVRALGVLLLSLVVLAGTLIGAVVVDLAVPTEGAAVTLNLVAGISLTCLSVGVAVLRRRRPAA